MATQVRNLLVSAAPGAVRAEEVERLMRYASTLEFDGAHHLGGTLATMCEALLDGARVEVITHERQGH